MKREMNIPLPSPRKLFFSEQVDQKSIVNLTKAILEINEQDDHMEILYKMHGLEYTPPPIEIYIDSYGGSIYQVLGLIGVMEVSSTLIHTYVTGAAMSAGFMILISGDYRYAYPHSTPLYHQISSVNEGELKFLEESVKETKRLQKKIENMVMQKTKITHTQLKEIYRNKVDWYMTSEQALELGVVDEIVSLPERK